MATIVAAAGGGNWSATATWVGGVVPTATSDVQLNATSGAVTIDVASACRSLDCTGYVSTLTHNAFTLSIGDATAGLSNIALKLVAGMTYAIASAASSINFVGTNATSHSVDYAGKTIGNQTYSGLGSNRYWASAIAGMFNNSLITLTGGTLHTDGASDNLVFTHNLSKFSTSGSGVKSLQRGSSTFKFVDVSTAVMAVWDVQVTGGNNTTLDSANTSKLLSNRDYTALFPTTFVLQRYFMNGTTWGDVQILGDREHHINGGTYLNKFYRIGLSSPTQSLVMFSNVEPITISPSCDFRVQGVDNKNRMIWWPGASAETTNSKVNITGVSLAGVNDWVSIQDMFFINGGANVDFTGRAGIIGNGFGNVEQSGAQVLFDAGVTCTWQTTVSGLWSDVNNWLPRVPRAQDNVIINKAFSSAQTITCDTVFMANNIDFTGSTGATFALLANCFVTQWHGNMTLRNGMTLNNAASMTWIWVPRKFVTFSDGGGGTITSLLTLQGGESGTLGLLTNIKVSGDFAHRNGTFTDNGFDLQCARYTYTQNSLLVPCVHNHTGSITFTSTSATAVLSFTTPTRTTVNSTGDLKFLATSANARSIDLAGKTFGRLIHPAGTGAIVLDNTSGTEGVLNKISAPSGGTLSITAGRTIRIGDGCGRGFDNGANVVTLNSLTAASTATFKKNLGVFQGKNLVLQDITATGGATFYADTSTNTSNNTGWNFSAAPAIDTKYIALSI